MRRKNPNTDAATSDIRESPGPRARRAPVQERSAETVRRIRDAASRLLGQGISPATLTTGQIAAEAGVAVGSIYRFFPDKQAIVDAVAMQRMTEFQEALASDVGPLLHTIDGPTLLARLIDAFMAFLDANPDFRTVSYGERHISRSTREDYVGADAGATVYVKRYLVEILGLSDTPDLELRLRVAVEVGDRLIAFALEQAEASHRDRILLEAKRLLSDYLFK